MKDRGTRLEKGIYLLKDGRYRVRVNVPCVGKDGSKCRRDRERICTTIQDARDVRDHFSLPNQSPDKFITLGRAYQLYEPHKQQCRNAKKDLKKLREVIAYFGTQKEMRAIKALDLVAARGYFLQQKNGRGEYLRDKTVVNKLQELRAMMRWFYDLEILDRVPRFPMKFKDVVPELPITYDEFLTVLPHLPPPHRAICAIAFNLGLRRNAAFHFTKDRIVVKDSLYCGQFYRAYWLRGFDEKNQRDNIYAAALDTTLAAIQAVPDNGTPYVAVNARTKKPFTNIQYWLDRASQNAGVPRFTMHTLRHLFTTTFADMTDLDKAQMITGHSTKTSAKRYRHLNGSLLGDFAALNALTKQKLAHLQTSQSSEADQSNNKPLVTNLGLPEITTTHPVI